MRRCLCCGGWGAFLSHSFNEILCWPCIWWAYRLIEQGELRKLEANNNGFDGVGCA